MGPLASTDALQACPVSGSEPVLHRPLHEHLLFALLLVPRLQALLQLLRLVRALRQHSLRGVARDGPLVENQWLAAAEEPAAKDRATKGHGGDAAGAQRANAHEDDRDCATGRGCSRARQARGGCGARTCGRRGARGGGGRRGGRGPGCGGGVGGPGRCGGAGLHGPHVHECRLDGLVELALRPCRRRVQKYGTGHGKPKVRDNPVVRHLFSKARVQAACGMQRRADGAAGRGLYLRQDLRVGHAPVHVGIGQQDH
mmetsp:Transcript_66006/g.182788  ORF Transcript_66006/g.182788 Transcript_66006/m.182788 type:complete len:256 (-) Transcript_66006:444-1211(-)